MSQLNNILTNFEFYLKQQILSESSIKDHKRNIRSFYEWAVNKGNADIVNLRYTDLMEYIKEQREHKLSIQTLKIRLNSLSKYYEHCKDLLLIENNPTRKIKLRDKEQKIIQHPLSYAELEQLFTTYSTPKKYREKTHQAIHQRNIVLLSLLIWQGLHTGELEQVQKTNIDLEQGIIHITANRRSKPRDLQLHHKQILVLNNYLNTLPADQEVLFTGSIRNNVQYMLNDLKAINGHIKNAFHIRGSVILHWLKMYDKRKVQYMIGHKYISSTEHYEAQEVDTLSNQIVQHHPFG